MNSIYFNSVLTERILITPTDLNKDIDEIILQKLINKVEGKCNKHGYVRNDSVSIISRSVGRMNPAHFTGNIIYNIRYSADICNPSINTKLICKIMNINKMGITAYIEDPLLSPLNITLANQHHWGNKEFQELAIGMFIKARIIGKSFEYNDKKILTIALYEGIAKENDEIVENDYRDSESDDSEVEDDVSGVDGDVSGGEDDVSGADGDVSGDENKNIPTKGLQMVIEEPVIEK